MFLCILEKVEINSSMYIEHEICVQEWKTFGGNTGPLSLYLLVDKATQPRG